MFCFGVPSPADLRTVRHECQSEAGANFVPYVDDYLRPVLRNIQDPALAHGCLTVKRDPRPLLTAPAYLALSSRARTSRRSSSRLLITTKPIEMTASELSKRSRN